MEFRHFFALLVLAVVFYAVAQLLSPYWSCVRALDGVISVPELTCANAIGGKR